MHETGVVESLIHEVERIARRHGCPKVASVRVQIGTLSPFSEEHLREHFIRVAKGTLAEHAELVFEQAEDSASLSRFDRYAQDVVLISIELEEPQMRPAPGMEVYSQ